MRTLPPITLTTGNPIPIEIGNDAAGVLIANESSFSIQVNIGAVIAWLPAWTIDYYDLSDLVTIGTATLSAQMLTSASNAPSSVALVSILAKNDKVTGTYPCALARQTNIGNGVVTTSTTNTLQNDGSAPNTQIIETTPNDEVTSAFVLDNEGNLTLRTKDAGVWSIIMSIIAGSGGGAATKLFHGTSDNVPATGITSGIASTGMEVGTDSTHKFSMHDLGGYTSTNGIIEIGESVWMCSDINVGMLFNCYYDGTNYKFMSSGEYAAQILISKDAFGGTVPHFTIRYSSVSGTAGSTITWNAWQAFPIMSDNGGIGGAHIFTGTTTPSGQVAGDLWFNG